MLKLYIKIFKRMDFDIEPVNRKKYFETSRCQRYRNNKRIKELLIPAISFARTIGLKLGNLEFREMQDNEEDYNDIEFTVKRENPLSNEISSLKGKDLAYMSDRNYHTFRKETNLQQYLPSLRQIKSQRSDLNAKFEMFTNPEGNGIIISFSCYGR